MYKLAQPKIGCIVYASPWHEKLKQGARIGTCTEVLKDVIRVSDGDREFAIMSGMRKLPFHEFWMDGERDISQDPRLISTVIEEDFNCDPFMLARKCGVIKKTAASWCGMGWVLYRGVVYSPKYFQVGINHDQAKMTRHLDLKKLDDKIRFKIGNNWLLFSETLYKPKRIY